MTLFLVALAAVMTLVLRERRRLTPSILILAAALWPAFALIGYVRFKIAGDEIETFWVGGAIIYVGVIVVTFGRPALLLCGALPEYEARSQSEARRARAAQWLLMVLVVVVGVGPEVRG